jgi:hypothetical protein
MAAERASPSKAELISPRTRENRTSTALKASPHTQGRAAEVRVVAKGEVDEAVEGAVTIVAEDLAVEAAEAVGTN